MINVNEEKKYFREQLNKFRDESGYSEYSLSRKLGKCESYIQSLSSGKNMPSMKSFFEICQVLNKSPKDFFMP